VITQFGNVIAPTKYSLFVAKRPFTYSQENIGKILRRIEVGGEKWRAAAQKRQYL